MMGSKVRNKKRGGKRTGGWKREIDMSEGKVRNV